MPNIDTARRRPIERNQGLGAGTRYASGNGTMVLKIELHDENGGTVFTLIGRITSQDVQRLKAELDATPHCIALDLAEVHLVDLDAVAFLADARGRGIGLRRLPRYVSEWLRLETRQLERTDHGTHVGGGIRQREEGL